MGTPFLGEVRIFSFGFAPKGWAFCNGQFLPINQNQALFALLGTTYGGNGVQTFALPNLQGRMPISFGSGYTQGQAGGEVNHTLLVSEMPSHTHTATASSGTSSQASPKNNVWAEDNGQNLTYATASNAQFAAAAITSTGGSQPHANMMPYLTLNFCMAMQGIFPSRN